ncbi:hypothetical protein FEM48_Zijuj03G0028800 [Ziziphus jujuba var. spinosa]|uniref:Uncharacterized protein n=1 Tax=Ziziphus jujuba var. spinosa TaxID=714518 RepID=A0A978VMR3_ZIZJJ|nr:hypothetical protein FEM48_Zijuj03G0028800 [Ziziphus jujuba var. spinosa]
MERSHLKSPIEDSRRFALFGNRQWLCGENLMENTVVLSLTDQSEGTIETPTQKKHFGLWTFKTLCIHTEYSSSFWCQLDHVVLLTMEFDDREIFQWSKVTTSINNLILEKLYCDHCSTMRIQGNHNYSCKLKFKEQSIIDQNPHQVHGLVQDRNGKTIAILFGKWDESMHYVDGNCSGKGKGLES